MANKVQRVGVVTRKRQMRLFLWHFSLIDMASHLIAISRQTRWISRVSTTFGSIPPGVSGFQACTATTAFRGGHLVCSTPFRNSKLNSVVFSNSNTPMFSTGTNVAQPEQPFADNHNLFSQMVKESLNDSQCQAVTHSRESFTRVVAGPGSGKTRVLIYRIAQLLQHNRNDRILAVTFTKKAAGEMQERLADLLNSIHAEQIQQIQQRQHDAHDIDLNAILCDDEYYDEPVDNLDKEQTIDVTCQLGRVTMGTFHSVCAKILRWNAEYLPDLPSVLKYSPQDHATINTNFQIADQTEQLRILHEVFQDADIKVQQLRVRPYHILGAISNCKEAFAQDKNPFGTDGKGNKKKVLSPLMKYAATCYEPYRRKLFMSNQLDFDDLIYLTRELLSEHETVRQRMRQRWNHILVDEFQDTSLSQLDLVKLLTSNSLFVVGDADQSIYSWRGAHSGMMQEFVHHFENVLTVHLTMNYRSTSSIVRAAEKVINSGKGTALDGNTRKVMISQREPGLKPRVLACSNGIEEGKFNTSSGTRLQHLQLTRCD